MKLIQIDDWYWRVGGDESKVFSSRRGNYVDADDNEFQAWTEDGGVPSVMDTEIELVEYLSRHAPFLSISLPLALIAYANEKQWSLATGGRIITVGGEAIPFSTAEASMALINGKVARLQQPDAPHSINWQTGPTTFTTIVAADFIAAAVKIADWVQSTFDALPLVFSGIEAGTITSRSQIDDILSNI
jgi:hypothetical protein